MKFARIVFALVFVALTLATVITPRPARATVITGCPNQTFTNRSWVTYLTGKGVKVCVLKDSSGNPVTFMQWIDLSAGARIRNAYESAGSSGTLNSPNFNKRKIENWWTWAQTNIPSPAGAQFSAVNGTYFKDTEGNSSVSQISFPLKDLGSIRTVGSDANAQAKRVFGIYNNGAYALIRNYTNTSKDLAVVTNSLSDVRDASIGYDPNYKYLPNADQRTWIGVADRDGNRIFESVMILTSKNATHDQALSMLRDDFFTQANVQMDSSSSTQLNIRGTNVISSSLCPLLCRNVPHAYIVYEAP